MPAKFNLESARFSVDLPPETRRQMAELMGDNQESARDCVIIAIQQRWQRECGEPERDIYAELDELKAQVAAIVPQKEGTKMYETIRFSELSTAEQDAIIADAIRALQAGDRTKYIWSGADYGKRGRSVVIQRRID